MHTYGSLFASDVPVCFLVYADESELGIRYIGTRQAALFTDITSNYIPASDTSGTGVEIALGFRWKLCTFKLPNKLKL